MEALGVDPGGDLVESGRWLYDYLSKSAHHRRGPITTSVSVEGRTFAYGPHPDPVKRARELSNAGQSIETALIVIADAISYIVGRSDLAAFLSEQAADLERVRQAHPLDPDGE
jgi:hypothetical protein